MASAVSICNLALAHLNVGTAIASLTEQSAQARACNQFYAQTRDEALRDFPWPFATTIEALGLVEEEPNSEWDFSYRYPAGCLEVRRILNGASRVETRDTVVPYRIARDGSGRLIFTGQAEAEVEYTAQVEDPTHYPPDFVQALALLLASYLAPRVTAGDPAKLGPRALQLYDWRMRSARANALNEEQPDVPPDGELVLARN